METMRAVPPIDFAEVLEQLPGAVMVFSEERVSWVNPAAEALLGYRREALLDRHFLELVAPDDREKVAIRYNAREKGEPAPPEYEIDALCADGSRRRVLLVPRAMGDGRILVLIRDLGAQAHNTELALRLAGVVAGMQRALDVESVLAAATDGLVRIGFDVFVLALDDDALVVQKAALAPEARKGLEAALGAPLQGRRFALEHQPHADALLRERRTIFVDDIPGLLIEALRREGAPDAVIAGAAAVASQGAAALLAPLVVRGEVWGVLAIASRCMDSRDVAVLRLFGVQLAIALEVAESVEALERHNRLLGAVHEIAAAAIERNVQALAARLTGIALAATESDAVAIHLLDEDGALAPVASRGCDAVELEWFGRLAQPLAARTIGSSGLRPLTAARRDPSEAPTVVHGAAIPLIIDGHLAGALGVGRRDDVPYDKEDLDAAELLAGQMAIQLESARLHGEAANRVDELELINEVGAAVAQHIDLDQLLKVAVRNLARVTGACRVFVLLIEQEPEVLRLVASNEEGIGREPLMVPAGSPSTAWACIREARPKQVYAPFECEGSSPALAERFGHHGVLAVPLIAGSKPVGAIVVGYTQKGRQFTRVEVDRTVAIANWLASALANAQLYRDLRESYRKLAEAQQQLVQRERLAAVGELAAVVAHEVRNPLCVVFNSTATLKRRLQGDEEVGLLLGIVEEEAERLDRLVGGMLDFTRTVEPDIRPERLQPILAGAVDAARAIADQGRVSIDLQVSDDTPAAPLDATMVRQAVLNLLVNAIQAMPRGGELRIEAGPDEHGAWLRLAVADTGHGIPSQLVDRIFDPFFTTKASGSGLGLAVVKRALEAHGGRVEVESSPATGTRFVLRFPLAQARAEG